MHNQKQCARHDALQTMAAMRRWPTKVTFDLRDVPIWGGGMLVGREHRGAGHVPMPKARQRPRVNLVPICDGLVAGEPGLVSQVLRSSAAGRKPIT